MLLAIALPRNGRSGQVDGVVGTGQRVEGAGKSTNNHPHPLPSALYPKHVPTIARPRNSRSGQVDGEGVLRARRHPSPKLARRGVDCRGLELRCRTSTIRFVSTRERRRWRSNPSGKCSQERLSRGTVTSTMRKAAHPSGCARCGAGAGCSAIKYQSRWTPLAPDRVDRDSNQSTHNKTRLGETEPRLKESESNQTKLKQTETN